MRARGFTLVEVLVTVTVIAVLMGVGLPALHAVQGYAREPRAPLACGRWWWRRRRMPTALEVGPAAVLYYQRNGVVVTQS